MFHPDATLTNARLLGTCSKHDICEVQAALYGTTSCRAYAIRSAGHALEKFQQQMGIGKPISLKRLTAEFLRQLEQDFVRCNYRQEPNEMIRRLFEDGVPEGDDYSKPVPI